MTPAELRRAAVRRMNATGERYGQALYNAAHERAPDRARACAGTAALDPFHNEDPAVIEAFIQEMCD